MEKDYLVLKRASASRPSGEWNDDDYDVLAEGVVVGRIMKAVASPVETPWLWTLMFGYHEDRTPTHGYAATRDAAMAPGGLRARARARRPTGHRPRPHGRRVGSPPLTLRSRAAGCPAGHLPAPGRAH